MIKIGFIGNERKEDLQKRLMAHPLFIDKEIEVIKYKEMLTMKHDLDKKQIQYMVLPSRTKRNEISKGLLNIINEIKTMQITEIGMLNGVVSYDSISHFGSNEYIGSKEDHECYTSKDGAVIFNKNKKSSGCAEEFLEYRIFKSNTYKPSLKQRINIFLIVNKKLRMMLSIISVLATATLFGLLIFNSGGGSEIIEAVVAGVTIILQIVLAMTKSEESAKRKLITGYWLYYSFEEVKEGDSFVPRGFKTRLMEISNIDNELCIKCHFEGEDAVFFSTRNVAFDYDYSTHIGGGFYQYTSNVRNNQGNRAEGTCRFEGECYNNMPILSMDGWFSGRGTKLTGTVKFVRISKDDFENLKKSTVYYDSEIIADNKIDIGVYGLQCSNTEEALNDKLEELIKKENLDSDNIIRHYYSSVSEMKSALARRYLDYIIVPMSNRGKLISNHDIFSEDEFEKIMTIDKEIKYCLGTRSKRFKLNNETSFYGHVESLRQCSSFIGEREKYQMSSSSYAASQMAGGALEPNSVCLCNIESIRHYGLYEVKDENGCVIDPYIDDIKNITSFAIYKYKRDAQ